MGQIEMELPRAHKPAALSGFGSSGSKNTWGSSGSKKAKIKHRKKKQGTTYAGMGAIHALSNTLMAAPTTLSMATAAAAPPQSPTAALEAAAEAEVVAELVEADESACVEADLNLARVQLGSVIGTSAEDDAVPEGAKRAAGVSVRLTRMGYGVASDGAITAPRVRRFIKQMSFDRRARSLAHGSLVTGQGTWGNSSQTAPISLPPLPSTIDALAELFVQFPTKDVQRFVTGGPDAALQLAVGEEMSVPGLFTLKNIGGTIVATRAAAASGSVSQIDDLL